MNNKKLIVFVSVFITISIEILGLNILQDTTIFQMPNLPKINSKIIYINSPAQIKTIKNNKVEPIEYVIKKELRLEQYEYEIRIKHFINLIIPEILIAKKEIELEKNKIILIKNKIFNNQELTLKEKNFLRYFFNEYEIPSDKKQLDKINLLLFRLHTPPISLILAQASLESGFGTSRFFREGNNFFGIQSFDPKEPRIQALKDKKVYNRKFSSIKKCIQCYLKILATKPIYSNFRIKLANNSSIGELIDQLDFFSQLRDVYKKRVLLMIKKYDLKKYDKYKLDIKK